MLRFVFCIVRISNIRFWHISDRPAENSGSSPSAYTLSMVCLVVLNSRAMTQMLIPVLICAITVVSVIHSELEYVQTAFRYPSCRYPALLHKGPINQEGYAQGPEVVRRGYVYCVRYEGTNKPPHQRWPFS
jgi:hypothetical protein